MSDVAGASQPAASNGHDSAGSGSVEPPPSSLREDRRRIVLWSLAATAPVFVTALVIAALHDWRLTGDSALEVIRARDVGAKTPLHGVYSRFGWAHPGPAIFLLFAAPARWPGNPSGAVVFVGVIVKWILAAGSVSVVWRAVGRRAALVTAGVIAIVLVHLLEGIWSVWNPTLAVPVLVAATLLCAFGGDRPITLPLAALLLSVMIQLHVGYAVPALVLVFALAWRQRPSRRVATAALATISVAWSLPLLDLVFGTRNARDLVAFAADSDLPTVGFRRAIGITARELHPVGPWIGGEEPLDFIGGVLSVDAAWLLLPGAALVFLGWFAATRAPVLWTLVAILAGQSAAAVVAIAQIVESPFPYLVVWVRVVAALLWGATAIAASTLVPWRSMSNLAAATVLTVVACVVTIQAPIETFESRATSALEPAALRLVEPGESIQIVFSEEFPGIAEGVALTLESAGRDVRLTAAPEDRLLIERMWGEHRVLDAAASSRVTFARDDMIDCLESGSWAVVEQYRDGAARAALLWWHSDGTDTETAPGPLIDASCD